MYFYLLSHLQDPPIIAKYSGSCVALHHGCCSIWNLLYLKVTTKKSNTQYQYQYLHKVQINTQYQYQYQYLQMAEVNTQYQYQYRVHGQYLWSGPTYVGSVTDICEHCLYPSAPI